MNKKSFLLEMIIKKPCSKCLVQACCTTECEILYRWKVRYCYLIDLNDILMMISGIFSLIFLGILSKIKLLDHRKAIVYAYKIEKIIEKNLR